MIDTTLWASELQRLGYRFASGVPCSSLSQLQNEIQNMAGFDYVAAANEGQAIGLGSGAWAGGAKSVVMMQNSGLGNAVNPLTSLVQIFRIPLLLLVSWRGQPGRKDEPQHALMGEISTELLRLLRVPVEVLEPDHGAAMEQIKVVSRRIDQTGQTCAIVVPDKSFSKTAPARAQTAPSRSSDVVVDMCRPVSLSKRADALGAILASARKRNAICVGTTGKTGREMYTLDDNSRNLYMVGSMGLASAFGLGLSQQIDRETIVIDGDGAAMMHMGILATIGRYGSARLKHIILDNACYDSTGCQPTNSENVDFAVVASACGYAKSYRVNCPASLVEALEAKADGPSLIHMRIAPGSMTPLGRPDIAPDQVLRRLQNNISTMGCLIDEPSYA